jgi:predicted component of type VI protein secretion system
MPDNDEPQGGLRLDAGFGDGGSVSHPARLAADLPFRLLVVGDFGGPEGRLVDASGENVPSLLASFGATVELEAPNRLGSTPRALAIRLAVASLRDLDPKTIRARVPALVDAECLRDAFQSKSSPAELERLAARADLDRVVAALRAAPAASSSSAAPSTAPARVESDDGSLDRLLDMVETPAPPDVAKAAVSAFVASLGKTHSAAPASNDAVAGLLAEQAQDISAHPAWLGVEAAWRSLQMIFSARASRAATRIEILQARRGALADVIEGEGFGEAIAGVSLNAILVLGAFSRSVKDLEDLDRIARVAQRLATPTIVSLDKDFFGVSPASVSTMDNPGALLEGQGYAAWRGLRGRGESDWLFACWNDFVLRSNAADAPLLWGEPGVIVATQILRSLARTGWPTEILGAETALGGLELAEVETRGGRRSAIALRALMDLGVARDLGREGVICLACRPDRDAVWLARAPSLHAHGAAPEAERRAMENLGGLPFRFVSTYFENLLGGAAAALSPCGADAEEIAASIARLARDALIPTGLGGAAHVTPVAPAPEDDRDMRRFEVSIRLGRDVMGGFEFSFDLAL